MATSHNSQRQPPEHPTDDISEISQATETKTPSTNTAEADVTITQPSLFFPEAAIVQAPTVQITPPVAESGLLEAAPAYQEYLKLTDHSPYTITCFLSDLRLLGDFLGDTMPLGRITNNDLTRWLMHLRWGRGHQPAPKTMARRATFLKNFFGWLADEGIIPENPAAGIILTRPLPPLPELLDEEELAHLEAAAAEDSRSHCLVILLLHAGLKKEEIMGLQLNHFDLTDPARPMVSIEFTEQAKQGKKRHLPLPAEFTQAFQRYLTTYRPQEKVFACTDRNLNYILARTVRKAQVPKRVTLQLLRDMYAVRQLQDGVPLDSLREKLGLSEEAWKESAEKYRKLVANA